MVNDGFLKKVEDKYLSCFSKRRYEKENIFPKSENYFQPKNWLLSLKQFVGSVEDPDYYIRFSGVPSLTINPRFEKANILGIYGFAFTRHLFLKILSGEFDLIFSKAKYLMVFKPKDKSKILNKFNYSHSDFEKDMDKIRKLYFPNLSDKDKIIFDKIVKEAPTFFENERFFLLFLERLRNQLDTDLFGKELYNSSKLFMDLGYHGIYDGKEAVFFSGAFLSDPLIFENPLY
jgi:hypothetical protein